MKPLTLSAKHVLARDEAGKITEFIEGSTTINAPETALEAIEQCGDEAVLTNAMSHFVVYIQGGMRRDLKADMSAEDVAAKYADSKMGVTRVRVAADPFAKIKGEWATKSKEDRKKFLQELKEME